MMKQPEFQCSSKAVVFCLIVIFLIVISPIVFTKRYMGYKVLNKPLNIEVSANNTCKNHDKVRINVQTSEFEIRINEQLQNCFQPELDSGRLSASLDFMWRPKAAPIYRHGCWAPTFSRIDKINHTLIIDCPSSMQPKYGFQNRGSIKEVYTGPVSMNDREWVYAQCSFPFHPKPTIRIHFHAQPLPKISTNLTLKPNVVFIQFDALGRQAMYRRMPRSYKILSSYSKTNSSSITLTELRDVQAIEFPHLNVNGRNSEPNMRKLYCGTGNCQKTSLLRFYKEAGYSTSLMESYSSQLSNYIPSGVVDRLLASNYFGEYGGDTVELYYKNSGCVTGNTWIVDEMLNYLRDRFIAMRLGGWFSINNIIDSHSEDELNNYAVMDVRFHEFLLELNKAEALDNTILIVLADHGLHGHDWKDLWRAFDHRNPFFQILIGKNVKDAKDIIKHLITNSDKLIGHADLYTTFVQYSNISQSLRLPNAINILTEEVPGNRTCRSAGIPDEWCNCWVHKLCVKS